MEDNKNFRKRKLKNLRIGAIALVDKGANNRQFHLFKSQTGGTTMDQDVYDDLNENEITEVEVIELLKGKLNKIVHARLQAVIDIIENSLRGADKPKAISILKDIMAKLPKETNNAKDKDDDKSKAKNDVTKFLESFESFEKAGKSLSKKNQESLEKALKMVKEAFGLIQSVTTVKDVTKNVDDANTEKNVNTKNDIDATEAGKELGQITGKLVAEVFEKAFA